MTKHNEPVAWRYRSRGGEWFFTCNEALRDKVEQWGYDLEPLYSSPQNARIEGVENLVSAIGVIQLLKEDSK